MNRASIDESPKRLESAIDGSTIEVGKPNGKGKYEIYKYEAFHAHGCSIQWKETHEVSENGRRVSLVIQEITTPLSRLSAASVRQDKVGTLGHLVSFTTIKLKPGITSHIRSVYEDGSDDKTTAIQTGYGFYFSKGETAERVAKAVVLAIRSCTKAKTH